MRRTWVKYLVTWIRSTDAFTISGLQNAAPYILALVTPYMIKHRLQACKVMDLYASLDIHQPWSLNRSKPTASLSGPWREEKRERKRGCVISIRENSARSAITTTLNGWTFEVPWKQTPILHMSHCVTTAVMYGVWCFWKHKPCWKITITKKKKALRQLTEKCGSHEGKQRTHWGTPCGQLQRVFVVSSHQHTLRMWAHLQALDCIMQP